MRTQTSAANTSPFIPVDELKARLGDPDVKLVDGSWYLPAQARDAEAEFLDGHIPGAVRFDIDAVADPSSGLPHMLPDAKTFGDAAGALGMSETDTIVVYDGMGLFAAPRVWWSFVVMGARNVRILEGGLPAWIEAGGALESGPANPVPAIFHAARSSDAVASRDDVLANIESKQAQLVDLRPAARFAGAQAEPREGLKSGHVPGSFSLPFAELVSNGRLIDNDGLLTRLGAAGIDPEKPAISSCGSGVTAAFYNLALAQLGLPPARLYDGSWAEWGAGDNPVVKD